MTSLLRDMSLEETHEEKTDVLQFTIEQVKHALSQQAANEEVHWLFRYINAGVHMVPAVRRLVSDDPLWRRLLQEHN